MSLATVATISHVIVFPFNCDAGLVVIIVVVLVVVVVVVVVVVGSR